MHLLHTIKSEARKKQVVTSFILILLLLPQLAFAQSKNRNLIYADKYFKIQDYYLAMEYYAKALKEGENTDYVHYQLGECDRLFYEYEEAEEHYKIVVENDNKDYPLAIYYYALMLKTNSKYKMSVIQFDNFLRIHEEKDKFRASAILEKKGSLYILSEYQKTLREYNFKNLGEQVNTPESDFAPTIYGDDSLIIFSSARINTKREEIYGRLGGAFLDNYIYDKTTDSTWVGMNDLNHFDHLNTQYHDGPGTFNTNETAYYFTRCDEKGSKKHEYHCAIYVSELGSNRWGDPKKLNANINKKNSWNAHPSLSKNGDTLFFASKREGGLGETDIWYSVRIGTDLAESWGAAINMGKPVNTQYIDMSPQYNAKEDVLLFASNGHVGFGGLDLFVAKGDNFKEIRNLGLPFNSNHDDFHMVMGDSIGYLSSNREGGIGNDDIYSFNLYSNSAHLAVLDKSADKRYDHVDMYGKISARGDASTDEVDIIVTDEKSQLINSTVTNKEGEFTINDIDLQNKKEISITLPEVHLLSEYNYVVDSLMFTIKSSIVQVGANDTSSIDIGGVVLDKDGNPVKGEKVTLLDKNGNELMHTLTNEDGKFMFRSLDGNKEYTLRVDNDSYSISNTQVLKNKDLNTESIADANEGLASRIKAESIYFDFNSSLIRKEASKTLKDIKKIMDQYPNVSLELHGYTDSYGSSAYNIALGESRGNATLNSLEKSGVDRSRIQVKTHGESEPVASNKTFEGRQLNRRVDFYLLGGAKYNQKAKIHIMKPGSTLNEVARKYNMTLEELKELNDLSSNTDVTSYAPIRVRNTGGSNSAPITMSINETTKKEEKQISFDDSKYIVKNDKYHDHVKYKAKPYKGYYLVLPKNTLYTISVLCKVHVDTLKKINGLTSGNIVAGQILKVVETPAITKEEFVHTQLFTLSDAGVKVSDHVGKVFILDGESRYVVKGGDTVYSISKRFKMEIEELKRLNNLKDNQIRIGMVLNIVQ